PCSAVPSQTIAKRSPPMSLEPGCTTVSVIAVASAASTAVPPRRSTASPAEAASGWLVATTARGAWSGTRGGGMSLPSDTVCNVDATLNIGTAHRPLRDKVVDELRRRIIDGVYRPGDRLTEERLAEHFGVSRNPVREAIRVLESEGFLVAQP